MSSNICTLVFVPVNSILYTSRDVVYGRGKKVPSMSIGNDIINKLCHYLEVSPSLLEPLFTILLYLTMYFLL